MNALATAPSLLHAPLPAHWPVSRALDVYLAENGFTKDEYDKPTVSITFWWLTFPFPNPPSRHLAIRFHDLHHVVTGYGTDPGGEAEISAWELRRGIGGFSLFVQGVVTSGAAFGLLHAPRRTVAAWRRAPGLAGEGLQPVTRARYDELLAMTVGELRACYGVPEDGLTGARALHGAAPPECRRATGGRTGPVR